MKIADILNYIACLVLDLIIKPLTPIIDYIFSRLIVVATSQSSVKRYHQLANNLVDYATSDTHREDTFKTINKIVCIIPSYLEDCGTQRCLRNLTPVLLQTPRVLVSNRRAVIKGIIDNLTLFFDFYKDITLYLSQTGEGIITQFETACALQSLVNVGKAIGVTMVIGGGTTVPTDFISVLILSLLQSFTSFTVIDNMLNPIAFIDPDVREAYLRTINNPCDCTARHTVMCTLRGIYEGHFDPDVDYNGDGITDETNSGLSDVDKRIKRLEDLDTYMSYFSDKCVFEEYIYLVENYNSDEPAYLERLQTFKDFLTGDITKALECQDDGGEPFLCTHNHGKCPCGRSKCRNEKQKCISDRPKCLC